MEDPMVAWLEILMERGCRLLPSVRAHSRPRRRSATSLCTFMLSVPQVLPPFVRAASWRERDLAVGYCCIVCPAGSKPFISRRRIEGHDERSADIPAE